MNALILTPEELQRIIETTVAPLYAELAALRAQLNDNGEMLSREVVMQELGVSSSTLRNWERSGELVPAKRIGRRVYYSQSSVRAKNSPQKGAAMKPEVVQLPTERTTSNKYDFSNPSQVVQLPTEKTTSNKYDFSNLSQNDIYNMAWDLLTHRSDLTIDVTLSLAEAFVVVVQRDIRKHQGEGQ